MNCVRQLQSSIKVRAFFAKIERIMQLQPKTGTNNQLRYQNQVPGVLYGKNLNKTFAIDYVTLEKQMRKGSFFNQLLQVTLDDQTFTVLAKDTQSHVVSDRILHLELQNVDLDQIVTVNVPVKAINTHLCDSLKRGGSIRYTKPFIKMRCKARDIPSAVLIDVASLNIGSSVSVSSINQKSCNILLDPKLTILKIVGKRVKDTETE